MHARLLASSDFSLLMLRLMIGSKHACMSIADISLSEMIVHMASAASICSSLRLAACQQLLSSATDLCLCIHLVQGCLEGGGYCVPSRPATPLYDPWQTETARGESQHIAEAPVGAGMHRKACPPMGLLPDCMALLDADSTIQEQHRPLHL